MVVVEPRGTGMALFTLRAAEEVRAAQFGIAEGELDAEMVAIAKTIIAQRTGSFDPTTYRDRYQEALQELIEAKMKGLTVKPREIAAPPPVIDLMTALKRSLAREASGSKHTAPKKAKMAPDRRQRLSCCPFPGVGNGKHRPPSSPPLPPQGGANRSELPFCGICLDALCAWRSARSRASSAVPEVRIHLPPAASLSLSRSSFRRSRTRLSARVWAAGLATGSAETRRVFRYRVNRRQYLCRAIFQYRSAAGRGAGLDAR